MAAICDNRDVVSPRVKCPWFLGAVATASCFALLGSAQAYAFDPNDLNATISTSESSDRMSAIGACGRSSSDSGFCAEIKRRTPGSIALEPGQKVVVLLEDQASRVRADVVRRENRETVEQYPGLVRAEKVAGWHRRKWKFTAPPLFDASHVLAYVDYRPEVRSDGDQINSATYASRIATDGR